MHMVINTMRDPVRQLEHETQFTRFRTTRLADFHDLEEFRLQELGLF